jgi:hypothetical protein
MPMLEGEQEVRLHRKLRKQSAVEPANESREETNISPNALPGLYVNWAHAFNYFGGTHSVVSELIESWRKRRSRHA